MNISMDLQKKTEHSKKETNQGTTLSRTDTHILIQFTILEKTNKKCVLGQLREEGHERSRDKVTPEDN